MKVESLIIGGGVVGLAIAAKLSDAGQEVVVLEKGLRLGEESSSRNSGVIHAGIYYPKKSLKASLCIQGNKLLYQYAKTKNLPFKNTGKLIVATEKKDLKKLNLLLEQGRANKVQGLSLLTEDEIKEKEPHIKSLGAIFSQTTGIIDAGELLFSLEADILRNNGIICLNSEVLSIKADSFNHKVAVKADENYEVTASNVINSTGLNSIELAHKTLGINNSIIPESFMAKGHYYQLSGSHSFQHLIYPLPDKHGLGIHLGLGLDGRAKFGPDVEWINEINYSFDETIHQKFVDSIKAYWPSLDASKLIPDYTGIRSKVHGPLQKNADFIIQTDENHGKKGLINLFGIESPGLTSSLAIAELIARKLS